MRSTLLPSSSTPPSSSFAYMNHLSDLSHHLATCSIFWMSLITLQRIAGCFPFHIHAGLPQPVPALFGFGMVTTGHYLTSVYAPKVNQFLEGKCKFTEVIMTNPLCTHAIKTKTSKADLIRSSVCTSLCFVALERSIFKTVLPSSSISIGAYARKSASLLATGEVATSAQRVVIQKFGIRHGCHQCGSRQIKRQMYRETIKITPKFVQTIAGTKGFIADHMPPTLFLNTILKSKLAKITRGLGYPIKQRLYPQCIKCYSIQGHNVKTRTQQMIFHSRPRLVHLSPFLAYCLTDTNIGQNFVDDIVDPLITTPLLRTIDEWSWL